MRPAWLDRHEAVVEDLQAERAAFEPCVPNDFVTLGEGFEVLPCPARLPQDLEVGQKVARWFGSPYNAWYTGKIEQVNKRKTIQDNVTAEFTDETHGTTWGHWVASADTYGADRKWVLLKPVPIELDDEEMGEAAGSSAKRELLWVKGCGGDPRLTRGGRNLDAFGRCH